MRTLPGTGSATYLKNLSPGDAAVDIGFRPTVGVQLI